MLALWGVGCISSQDVVEWADRRIELASHGAEVPNWVLDLSLEGLPAPYFKGQRAIRGDRTQLSLSCEAWVHVLVAVRRMMQS